MMTPTRVEPLLKQFAKLRPPERLFSEQTTARLRERLRRGYVCTDRDLADRSPPDR